MKGSRDRIFARIYFFKIHHHLISLTEMFLSFTKESVSWPGDPGVTQSHEGSVTNQRPASGLCDQSEARIQGREGHEEDGSWITDQRSLRWWSIHTRDINIWFHQTLEILKKYCRILPSILTPDKRPAWRGMWGVLIKLQLIRLSVKNLLWIFQQLSPVY